MNPHTGFEKPTLDRSYLSNVCSSNLDIWLLANPGERIRQSISTSAKCRGEGKETRGTRPSEWRVNEKSRDKLPARRVMHSPSVAHGSGPESSRDLHRLLRGAKRLSAGRRPSSVSCSPVRALDRRCPPAERGVSLWASRDPRAHASSIQVALNTLLTFKAFESECSWHVGAWRSCSICPTVRLSGALATRNCKMDCLAIWADCRSLSPGCT